MSHPDAFQKLAQIFTSRDNRVLEIEIIPTSLGTILQDGTAIGTTKKTLIQAYTVARQLFFERLQPMSEEDLKLKTQPTAITEIMLLFDCEHLTACNWRKRRLRATASPALLEAELTLLSSYQCSPLHRHTKSPTLWHHRLWTLGYLLRVQTWKEQDLLSLQSSELDVVLRAAELHPRNYYAFSYMRQVSVLLAGKFDLKIVERVLEWCLANPRDISGWSFAVFVLEGSSKDVQVRALEKVIRFALSVGWEGESLWTFVAQAARQFGLEETVERMIQPDKLSGSARDSKWQTWLGLARVYWAEGRDQWI